MKLVQPPPPDSYFVVLVLEVKKAVAGPEHTIEVLTNNDSVVQISSPRSSDTFDASVVEWTIHREKPELER